MFLLQEVSRCPRRPRSALLVDILPLRAMRCFQKGFQRSRAAIKFFGSGTLQGLTLTSLACASPIIDSCEQRALTATVLNFPSDSLTSLLLTFHHAETDIEVDDHSSLADLPKL